LSECVCVRVPVCVCLSIRVCVRMPVCVRDMIFESVLLGVTLSPDLAILS